MLQTEAVEPATLQLLRSLQAHTYMEGFYLVGGTALALLWGHRKSEDLDLFSNSGFAVDQLLEKISQDYDYSIHFTAENTLKGNIGKTKVDFIAHKYAYLEPPMQIEEVNILSIKDIMAMKLNAISVSGERSKDYVDVYFALERCSISDMLAWYKKKYQQNNTSHVLKSLVYFDDVVQDDWPVLLKQPRLKWDDVCKKIEKEVKKLMDNRHLN